MINAVTGGVTSIRCGHLTLDFSEPRIMGVLNVTPDSFSDGGRYYDRQSAVDRALQMIEDGAYIIDIGGESTRPGSSPVSSEEELRRILPVIREIRSRTAVPISVDTYHPDVAAEALRAGADIVNDVTGLRTGEMRNVIRAADCPFVIMHMLGRPASMQKSPQYDDVVYEVMRFLAESLRISEDEGIDVTKGIVDPGIGFGKSFQHNITLLNRLDELLTLGHPVLLGASRKSFIGSITGSRKQNRLEGSLAAAVLAYAKGAKLLRVHDVLETRRALSVARCIVTGKMTEDGQQSDERP
ncbi:MAG: dihydropteroate synthase [Thermoplasmata archaeon]|nr:dihydropteroate synthase [Candidatus Sysuiplasma acidicola]